MHTIPILVEGIKIQQCDHLTWEITVTAKTLKLTRKDPEWEAWCSCWCPQGTLLFLGQFFHTKHTLHHCAGLWEMQENNTWPSQKGIATSFTKISSNLINWWLNWKRKTTRWAAALVLLSLLLSTAPYKRWSFRQCDQSLTEINWNVNPKCQTGWHQAVCGERKGSYSCNAVSLNFTGLLPLIRLLVEPTSSLLIFC